MRNLFNIRMTPLAFNLGMHALIEYIFVHIQESKIPVFIYPAEAGVFMTHQAVADIGGIRFSG
jgi:hypothetical protein